MGIRKFQGMLVRSGDTVHESFLFPLYGFWELISGPRDWLQMPLAVKPSYQTLNLSIIFILYVYGQVYVMTRVRRLEDNFGELVLPLHLYMDSEDSNSSSQALLLYLLGHSLPTRHHLP